MNLAQAIGTNRVIVGIALILDLCLLFAALFLLEQGSTLDSLINSAGPKGHAGIFLVGLTIGVVAANLAAIWMVWSDTKNPT